MPRHTRLQAGLLAVTAAFWLGGCATAPMPATIAETTAHTPQLSTLNRLIEQAGMTETLRGGGPYTLFAPTDEAFRAVPEKTLTELSANPERLKSVLGYHLLPARVSAAEVKDGPVATLQGAKLAVSHAGDFVTVDEALVQMADVPASNGVIHLVDRVLMPPKQ